ncbi:MAG TPA: transporter [Nitrospirota bacterium]|nr:transporter [Nitrospirota bacterium]
MNRTDRCAYMRTTILGWIIGMLLLAPVSAWAVHPFQVEDTDTQGTGNFLLELNGDHTQEDSELNTTTYSGILRAGVSESADVFLTVPYLMLNPSSVTDQNEAGLGDVQLGFKQRIYQNEVHQSFGYQVYTGLPTGSSSKGLGIDDFLVGFKLIDQQGCCSTIYHVSVGYESYIKHLTMNSAIQVGLALDHKFTESFHLLTELAGEDLRGEEIVRGVHPVTFMAGFKYDISKSWYVDLAARLGLNSDAEEYTTLVGTALRF